MKRLLIAILSVTLLACLMGAAVSAYGEDGGAVAISSAEEFLAINDLEDKTGEYYLTCDITLPEGEYVKSFYGTLDGKGHTVTVNNSVGLIGTLGLSGKKVVVQGGQEEEVEYTVHYGTVKNLTVDGRVYSANGSVGGVARDATGYIDGVTVKADISSGSFNRVAGFANCHNKLSLRISNCVFDGKVSYLQNFYSANNYSYFGIFLGYNGGAFGGGSIVNSIVRYTLSLPTADVADISKVEFHNVNNDKDNTVTSTYSTRVDGDNTVYTFDCVVNMNPVSAASISDEGIMAHYGSPVVRLVLKSDGSYRYIDGFDRANASYFTDFGHKTLDGMYKYVDISNLTLKKISSSSVEGEGEFDGIGAQSNYSELTVYTAEQFESFARIINSGIPGKFKNDKGEVVDVALLDTLAISVKLGDDIDLTKGDENGNASQFYGLGKHEFYPYRGGIDGGDHTLTVNIDAPNGYCVGVIGVGSEISNTVAVKNLTVEGSIKGNTRVGIVGYYDMVCNAYVNGGDLNCINVINNAEVSGRLAAGGLVGCITAANDKVKAYIENCQNNGAVTLRENGKYAGGLVGCAGLYGAVSVNIKNSSNSGNITALSGADLVGGLVGGINGQLSQIFNCENTGVVSADSGKIAGEYIGSSKSLMTDIEYKAAADGQNANVGRYDVTPLSSVDSRVWFKNESTANTTVDEKDGELVISSVYPETSRQIMSVVVENEATANIEIRLYVYKDGQPVNLGTEQEPGYFVNATGGRCYFTCDPGEYTLKLKAATAEGYYKAAESDEVELTSQATLKVSKRALDYTYDDVTVEYTGESVGFESAKDYDAASYKLPSVKSQNKAEWVDEYYKNGQKLSGLPKDAGEYTVVRKIVANDGFKACYDYTEEYTFKMSIIRKLVVTVNNAEIVKGEKANFTVSVTTFDGGEFDDVAALGLKFNAGGLGGDTSGLEAGRYTVRVSGKTELDGYEIEYKAGQLVVKEPAPVVDDQPKEEKKGCKSGKGLIVSLLFLGVAFGTIGKKRA